MLKWNETCKDFIRENALRENRAGGGWEGQQRHACKSDLEEREGRLGESVPCSLPCSLREVQQSSWGVLKPKTALRVAAVSQDRSAEAPLPS